MNFRCKKNFNHFNRFHSLPTKTLYIQYFSWTLISSRWMNNLFIKSYMKLMESRFEKQKRWKSGNHVKFDTKTLETNNITILTLHRSTAAPVRRPVQHRAHSSWAPIKNAMLSKWRIRFLKFYSLKKDSHEHVVD